MKDPIEELKENILEAMSKKKNDWQEKVFKSQQYQQEIKYLNDITKDFIDSLRSISFYSTRAGEIYDHFLCIRAIDDIIQSAIGILTLTQNGIHNTSKRELRYLIEMVTKYVIVDFDKMGEKIEIKTEYLRDEIPNSSIDIIERYSTPFLDTDKTEFQSEVKDFFYKACAYVHPSKKQIDEQLVNYNKGINIGFETAKMFNIINQLIFRAYDMILTMVFHGFGHSMSGDLFIQLFDDNKKWKFHKGKYVSRYSRNFDYKLERKK